MEFLFKIMLMLLFCVDMICGAEKEYCNVETFEATCAANEVIVMAKAQYGRMRIGRCIGVDLGYLGCGADVLYIFDEHCSGKQSCSMVVGGTDMGSRSTCIKDITQYLEADYKCVTAYSFGTTCSGPAEVTISSTQELILSDAAIDSTCIHVNKPWKLKANTGQRLNISLIDFRHDSNPPSRERYGKLVDIQSGRDLTFGAKSRFQELMLSVGNTVEVTFYSNVHKFAMDVKVLGCLDMSPTDGAWMTRDGDVMEVGCHSGSKSWTLRCENNHWIGAVGYCGTGDVAEVEGEVTDMEWNISLNVIVFGGCSIVLLISSIIFLLGVLLLKRKPPRFQSNMESTSTYLPPYSKNTMGYIKNEPNVPPTTMRTLQPTQVSTMPTRHAVQMYENGPGHYKSLQGKDRQNLEQSADSVKYFVLEQDAARQPMLTD